MECSGNSRIELTAIEKVRSLHKAGSHLTGLPADNFLVCPAVGLHSHAAFYRILVAAGPAGRPEGLRWLCFPRERERQHTP